MNTSKLKALLITAFCFVFALCSEIRCMDTASDFQESTSYESKNTNSEGCLERLKTDMGSDSSSVRLLLNQDENKASEASWASYISSPVKAVIHGTYNIVDFAVKHPTQTMITSLLVAAQFTAVAADCNCVWLCKELIDVYSSSSDNAYMPRSLGQFPDETTCQQFIKYSTNFEYCKYKGCY